MSFDKSFDLFSRANALFAPPCSFSSVLSLLLDELIDALFLTYNHSFSFCNAPLRISFYAWFRRNNKLLSKPLEALTLSTTSTTEA